MTYFGIVTLGNPPNPRDPIVGVWLEVSEGGFLPGRNDEDASVGIVGQPSKACDSGEAVLVPHSKLVFVVLSVPNYGLLRRWDDGAETIDQYLGRI